MKNWSGRNEIIETSGRLHPLWPQNKWLHMLWTTDYMHTRQDRWIQTELALTLAKNATKPNPFEIIPLQTTRKENNWKAEETLARVVVTLGTERIKGPNPWCLWWWTPQSGSRTTQRTYVGGWRRVHPNGSPGSRITHWSYGICIYFVCGSQNIQKLLPCMTLRCAVHSELHWDRSAV